MTHKVFTLFVLPALLCAGLSAATSASAQSRTLWPGSAQSSSARDPGAATTSDGSQAAPTGENTEFPSAATPNLPSQVAPNLASQASPNLASQASPNLASQADRYPNTARVAGIPSESTARLASVPAGPVIGQSEFELFAEDAAGRPLPVFGRQLFSETPSTFAPVDGVPVPADYVLGPGDQLLIRVWGKIDFASEVTVDRNGQIFLPKVGTFSVAGLHYEQLEGFLESAIGNLYKGFELNVSMGQLRSIQIYVLGSARQPGVYTVSSLSTLVNALFTSGGPSATGSMRQIELRRGNQTLAEFDIYDLLRKGDKSHDVQLLPGDVIYIPPVGPQVAIMGSVNEPGIYELKGETTLAILLKSAAGLTNLAGTDRVLLERIENHRRRRVDDFPLDISGLQRVLKDGDLLEIFPISPRFENAVTIRGNVAKPGRFPWHDGMRVSDVIPSRDFLVKDSYWHQQNHLAGNIHVEMMTDLSQNSAEINWDYAVIERLDNQDLSTRLIPFDLGNAVDNPASSDNQLLKVGDVLTIFSRKDLPLPEDKHASFVTVGGEVNAPGVYRIKLGETLRDVVERAGGLTPHSYLYASRLTRVSTRLAEEEQLRLSINQMQRELMSRYAAAPSLTSTSATEQQAQLAQQQAAIAQLSAVHPTGRVVLDMKPQSGTLDDIPAFPLEDGDSFYIPPRLSTVQVAGAVYNENAFRYQPKKRLTAYLRDAGGPTRQADAKRAFLIRADGTVVSRQSYGGVWHENFENLRLLPGDAIIVPTKLKSPNGFAQQLPFWTQMVSQTAMVGTIVGTRY